MAGVEAIKDAAQVAAARESWRRWRAQELSKLLARPMWIPYDPHGVEMLRGEPERSFQALVKVRDDPAQDAQQRLEAIVALSKLDIEPSPAQMVEMAFEKPENTFPFLVILERLWPAGTPLPKEIKRAIARALDHPRPDVVQFAEDIAQRHGLREYADKLFVHAREGENFRSLAKLEPSQRVFDFLAGGIHTWKDDTALDCAIALIDLAEATKETALRRRCVEEVVRFIAARDKKPDGGTYALYQIMGDVKPPELARSIAEPVSRTAKQPAAREWAEGCLEQLEAAERAATIDVAALRVFAKHGVITAAEASGKPPLKIPQDQTKPTFEVPSAIEALARLGRYLFLERTGERIPYRHDWILLRIAKQLALHFEPEAVMETYRSLDPKNPVDGVPGEYHVQFIHDGRLYRFEPEDLGYQYNVPAVVEAVNRALADANRNDRLVPYRFDSSAIEYLIAPPARLAAAAAELGIDLQHQDG